MTFEEEQAYIRKHLYDESVDSSSDASKENCVQAGLAVQVKASRDTCCPTQGVSRALRKDRA